MNFSGKTVLKRDTNQAYGLGEYAINFLKNAQPS